MKSKISLYLIPVLFSAILFYAFASTGNSSSATNFSSPNSGAGLNILILVHDSTLGSATDITKKLADRDTLRKYIPAVVGSHTLLTFDTNTVLPDLSSYDFIIIQETSFDVSACRYLGLGARNQVKAWLLSGTSLDKKRLLLIGADMGWNYSRVGSTGRDLAFSDTLCKFVYRLDNASGNSSPSVTGVTIDVGNTRNLTSTIPGGGYWPDGCSMSAGGVSLYKYQNHTAADTLAAIGYEGTGYRVGTMFQDPRYFTGGFGSAFDAMALWINENVPLPVELASFSHSVAGNNVTLNWSTSSELNNSGFDIERSGAVNEWTKIGFVEGNGTSSELISYNFTDRGISTGVYNYRLKQIDYNGNFRYYELSAEVNVGAPQTYNLSQNYPNPFNPSTTIEYALPNDGVVNITVYDMTGREVATLVSEFKPAGYHRVNFNASSLSSGNYLYRLESGEFVQVKKMILVK